MPWIYRHALKNLVLKDFRTRYRNMALGIGWSLMNPLVTLGLLVFVFSFLSPGGDRPYFPVFILLGLLPFNFFQLCVAAGTTCYTDNASLIKKVSFPRFMLPLSVVMSQAIHVAIQLLLLFFLIVLFGVPLTWSLLWLLPVLAVELIFIAGVTLAVSSLNVFFRDMLYIVQSGTAILFWLTPIFYGIETARANLSRPVYLLLLANPLVGCIDTLRRAVLEGLPPAREPFGIALGVSAAALALGLWIYRRSEAHLADHV